MNRGGQAEESPLAGRHEEVVGMQDGRVGQQKVLQLHVLVFAPEGKENIYQIPCFSNRICNQDIMKAGRRLDVD